MEELPRLLTENHSVRSDFHIFYQIVSEPVTEIGGVGGGGGGVSLVSHECAGRIVEERGDA